MLRCSRGFSIPDKVVESDAADAGIHIRTGAECNPGACYAALGISDDEVIALEGHKEGCADASVQFVQVARSPELLRAGNIVQGPPDLPSKTYRVPGELRPGEEWVTLPLGTVRASLGLWSTYEDAEALVDFLSKTYKR